MHNHIQFKTAISNANQHLLSRHIIFCLKLFKQAGADVTNCFKLQTLELWWTITTFGFDDHKERVATSAFIYFINLADENWHLLYPSNQIWVRNSWLLQAFLPCVLSLSSLCGWLLLSTTLNLTSIVITFLHEPYLMFKVLLIVPRRRFQCLCSMIPSATLASQPVSLAKSIMQLPVKKSSDFMDSDESSEISWMDLFMTNSDVIRMCY